MAEIFTWQAVGTAILIFLVRVLSITMDTLRFMLTMRGKRGIAWILGFLESVLFVITVGVVLNDSHISVSSKFKGAKVAKALRENDFAVTEIPAQGKDGPVCISDLSVRRKDVAGIEKIVQDTDPEAFVTIEDVTPLRAGYWGRQNVRR